MKRKLFLAITTIITVLSFNSCGTKEVVTHPTVKPMVNDTIINVTPHPDVVSIKEALDLFANPSNTNILSKKYGYKLKTNYSIYRLDKFSKMFYKNCILAKPLTADQYADYPKPQRKGTSSYVAFKEGALIVAVFNQTAYDNLVAQVKAAGFVLDMPGSEDIYVKGDRKIACYKDGKSIRIQ